MGMSQRSLKLGSGHMAGIFLANVKEQLQATLERWSLLTPANHFLEFIETTTRWSVGCFLLLCLFFWVFTFAHQFVEHTEWNPKSYFPCFVVVANEN